MDWRRRAKDQAPMAVMALGCCQLAIKLAQEIAIASSMQLGLPLAFGLKPTHSPIV